MRYQPPLETEQDIDNSLTSHRIRVSEHRHNRAYDPSEPGMRDLMEYVGYMENLLARRYIAKVGLIKNERGLPNWRSELQKNQSLWIC